jgi:hypothetical protein
MQHNTMYQKGVIPEQYFFTEREQEQYGNDQKLRRERW